LGPTTIGVGNSRGVKSLDLEGGERGKGKGSRKSTDGRRFQKERRKDSIETVKKKPRKIHEERTHKSFLVTRKRVTTQKRERGKRSLKRLEWAGKGSP